MLVFPIADVDQVRDWILSVLESTKDKVIYFDGWNGLGAAPVLRSVSQVLTSMEAYPPKSFDIMIFIDCSVWESQREMQRKIAKELKLGHKIMAIFDEQDEEDDFNGKDPRSRDLIQSVSIVIEQTLGYRSFSMVFLNGSDDEVDVSRFGITTEYRDHKILWTLKKKGYLTIHPRYSELRDMLRHTDFYVSSGARAGISYSEFHALLREEAASMDACTDCCLHELFVYYSFHNTTGFDRVAHASMCWICDDLVQGERAREISKALHPEISWDCDTSLLDDVFEKFKEDPESPFLVVKDDGIFEKRPYRWISITTSKNMILQEDMQTILERASSLFIAFEMSNNQPGLPNGLFKHCSNFSVLILSCCAFSFTSPPFRHCHTVRFLALDHCRDDNTSEGEDCMGWTCLHSVRVLDIRYTDWDEILYEEKMDLMANLRELNMEGVWCWQHTSQLQRRLPYLQRLRITKPMHHAEASSTAINDLFMDKTNLEILDLSGNSDMESLPASLSKASKLQVLVLDGCDGLEKVAMPDKLPSSLRSFSFDGYGPASHWTSTIELPLESSRPKPPSDASKKNVKTSEISLQGCSQLEKLFLRGLPNLVELDLSGTPIKILDFVTMMVDVPKLKRLFLLGCQHLRAIRWDSMHEIELICIDTRPWKTVGCTRPPLAKHKPFKLQVHAILGDARLVRSLCPLLQTQGGRPDDVCFNIHIVSSNVYTEFVQLEETSKEEMVGPTNQRHLALAGKYGDVLTEVVGDALIPMQAFPLPPTQQFDRHVEIGDGNLGREHELDAYYGTDNLRAVMERHVQSLHVHDVLTRASMRAQDWYSLRWCRVERCHNMETVFIPCANSSLSKLETLWASDLTMALCIWSKEPWRYKSSSFENLQHLHLRSCPRLQFVLPLCQASFPNLVTLHIIHCGDLMHIFALDKYYVASRTIRRVQFPKLTTIHLHNLPKLQQICEGKMMLAPALETIRIRGSFGLRRLPALEGRGPGARRPTVELEKDVWDALEWDGPAAGHHPDLFEPPVHSRFYKRRLLRGTVLR
ncbi:uncharacterized protein LOC133889475 [Phragmites australis]|uniref:uncharacterized protein LOC133889475 n=1 Tax=Phragmites australis TaxID=29695 RepID=UPI002D77677A|nr:uncharacterized protein LOC133889475 [Phragmites australis]